MKIKRLFAMLLALSLLCCAMMIPANAAEVETEGNVDIYIENQDISEETKEKIIAYYTNGGEDDSAVTYGLTCTLFGHKLEKSTVTTITHKVRTTSPRCLRQTYAYEACTRCDYDNATLMVKEYIICCS